MHTIVGRLCDTAVSPLLRRAAVRAADSSISPICEGRHPPRVRTASRESKSPHSTTTARKSTPLDQFARCCPHKSPNKPVLIVIRFAGIFMRISAVRNACRWSGVKPHARKMFVSRPVSGTGRRANFNASISFTGRFQLPFFSTIVCASTTSLRPSITQAFESVVLDQTIKPCQCAEHCCLSPM